MIRQAILTRSALVECPRCRTPLKTDAQPATEAHRPDLVWLFCETCKRNLVVSDFPAEA